MGLALRSKQPVFLHRCSKNDADKTSSAVWRKKTAAPRGCFLQSKPLLQEGDPADPQSYLLHFLLYAFIFTQQSAPYAGLVWSSFRRESEVIFRQSGLCTGTSPGKKGGCEKNFFHFSLPRPAVFLFAVRKTFRRNAFLFHHNSMQRPALCRQNAQPCSHKGNTPGETSR